MPASDDRPRPANYGEFWRFYVGEHRKVSTRRLHFAGTTTVLVLIAATILLRDPWLLLAVPVVAYAPAWIGHFVLEKNTPATLRYPFYSLAADFHMYGLMWVGRMTDEVARLTGGATAASSPGDSRDR